MLQNVVRDEVSDSLLRMVAYLALLERWEREGFVRVELGNPRQQEC